MRFWVASFLIVAAASSSQVGFADEKPWKEIRSPHFRVITNGSENDGRHVARAFEQMRSLFEKQFPGFRIDPSGPLLILAPENESTAKKLLPRLWEQKTTKPAGMYFHGWETQNALVRLDAIGSDQINHDQYSIVYHEYTHSVLRQNFRWLPTWLNEGLAEFYGYTRFEGSHTFVGAPPRNGHWLDILYRRPAMPLEAFLEQRNSFSHDDEDTHLFYAQSWALIHFLTFGPGMENGGRLSRFFDALQKGAEQKKAFQEAFGEFKKVQKDLDAYLNRFAFSAGVLDGIPGDNEKNFAARGMSVAETDAALGSFFEATRNWKDAREFGEAAAANDPKLAAAHELLGFVDLHEGKDQDAIGQFSEALALDSHLYRCLFAKTMLSPTSHSIVAADRATFQTALNKVLELNRQFAPAMVELAKSSVGQGDLKQALSEARSAENLEPSRAGYHLLTGQILLRMGRPAEAADHAAYVATRWHAGPDHDEATELWDKIPAAARSREIAIDDPENPDLHRVEGVVKAVVCADHAMTLSLEEAGQTITFHQVSGMRGFSDTLWEGSDHFTPCYRTVGLRVVVRYKAASDKSDDFEAVSFGFLDDLPPGPAPVDASPASPSPRSTVEQPN